MDFLSPLLAQNGFMQSGEKSRRRIHRPLNQAREC